jgi:HK97 family phage prohead protease
MKKEAMTFVLSDESVNSHGTWVKTSGINLERFKKNPVMLWSHDSAFPPIGKWENIRVEGDKLLADAVFDDDDPLAQAYKRKVESGLLKACSIGFYAKKFSSDMADIKPGQRFETIVEAELIECSLCSVGSNENAMVLMNAEGERLEMNERGFVALGMKLIKNSNNKENSMSEELTQLRADLQAKEDELVELRAFKQAQEQAEKERLEEARKELIENAINERKINATVKQVWLKLAEVDFETTKLALADMPSIDSIHPKGEGKQLEGKTFKQLSYEEQIGLKRKDFDKFKELYKEEFGVEYKGKGE